MNKIFIDKDIGLDERELAVIAVLNGLYSTKHENLWTSVEFIGYGMTGRFLKTQNKKDRNIIWSIKEALKSLEKRGIITILDQDGDNYVISGKDLIVDTEDTYFTVIELWELQKIFQSTAKPFDVFEFFVCLIGTINNKTKEWHMSQDEMTVYWGYGKGTVNKYLEQLEGLHLIYVYRHRRRRADGTFHKLNNSYGRYADKKEIIIAANAYADGVECEEFFETLDRRSIKQRYNAFIKGSKKYKDESRVKQLYEECIKYNKSLAKVPIEGTYEGEYKEGGLLDLSVFPQAKLESDCEFELEVWGEPNPLDTFIEEAV